MWIRTLSLQKLHLYKVVYVFELKYKGSVEAAFKQLEKKRYCYEPLERAKVSGKAVIAVGLNYTPGEGMRIIFKNAVLAGKKIIYPVAFNPSQEDYVEN